jgi:hypothetical protein
MASSLGSIEDAQMEQYLPGGQITLIVRDMNFYCQPLSLE